VVTAIRDLVIPGFEELGFDTKGARAALEELSP
jgi:hypothetical protein